MKDRGGWMKKGICYVVGAGENYGLDFKPEKEDYVIAADAGLHYLEEKGTDPDLIVGDFDTLNYVPDKGNVLKLPAEKDDTDMFMAVKEGIKAGDDFIFTAEQAEGSIIRSRICRCWLIWRRIRCRDICSIKTAC